MSLHHTNATFVSWARRFSAVLVFFTLGGIQQAILADPPQGTPRKIVSDDFTKNRPQTPAAEASDQAARQSRKETSTVSHPNGSQGQSANATTINTSRRRTYRLASRPVMKVDPRTKRPPSSVRIIAQLGITIWRLRPAGVNDTGRSLIREKGTSSGWVPERVEGETLFREGDHVRLSIESPSAGYLYVIDRDLLADGTTSGAMLIYPWIEADNKMRAGRLVDIPSQDDDPGYFTAKLTSHNQIGELLTFIVTSTPLDLPASEKPFQISNVQMSQWEKLWGGQSDRFEMEGGAGEAWTRQEQQASATQGARQLTRDDPGPQTIYRISTTDKKAILVNIQLRYGN